MHIKPKKRPLSAILDEKSIGILEDRLDKTRTHSLLFKNDKTPNYDGFIDVMDSDGYPVGKFEVQVKTLNSKRQSYNFELSFLAYVRDQQRPFLLFGINQATNKVFWRTLSSIEAKKLISEAIQKNSEQESIAIHFDSSNELSSVPPYDLWEGILHRFNRLVETAESVKNRFVKNESDQIIVTPPFYITDKFEGRGRPIFSGMDHKFIYNGKTNSYRTNDTLLLEMTQKTEDLVNAYFEIFSQRTSVKAWYNWETSFRLFKAYLDLKKFNLALIELAVFVNQFWDSRPNFEDLVLITRAKYYFDLTIKHRGDTKIILKPLAYGFVFKFNILGEYTQFAEITKLKIYVNDELFTLTECYAKSVFIWVPDNRISTDGFKYQHELKLYTNNLGVVTKITGVTCQINWQILNNMEPTVYGVNTLLP